MFDIHYWGERGWLEYVCPKDANKFLLLFSCLLVHSIYNILSVKIEKLLGEKSSDSCLQVKYTFRYKH